MDKSTFFDKALDGRGGKNPDIVEQVREQLEESGRTFYDISGNGTRYVRSGVQHGAGFAVAEVLVDPEGEGLVKVVVKMGAKVAPDREPALRKLFRKYNSTFKLTGLVVRDGQALFETEPFDPVNGRFDAATAVGLALSTVHAHQGVLMALDAGVDPWRLLGYGEDFPGSGGSGEDGDDDGDGGVGVALDSILESFRRHSGDDPQVATASF